METESNPLFYGNNFPNNQSSDLLLSSLRSGKVILTQSRLIINRLHSENRTVCIQLKELYIFIYIPVIQ